MPNFFRTFCNLWLVVVLLFISNARAIEGVAEVTAEKESVKNTETKVEKESEQITEQKLAQKATPKAKPKVGPKASTIVKMATTGELVAGKSYRLDLTRLILDATKAEYGDYRFEFYMNAPGASRQAMLLRDGDLVNVIWGSPGTVTSKVGAIVIPTDVYRGLLGRRVCIINSNNRTLFDSVTNFDTFQHVRVGQGLDWPDIEIYKFNKIIPTQAPSFEGIFGMLMLNRFDCLALGINEVDQFYHENIAQFPSIAIEKNLLIYYDLPIYIYVSPQYPKLAGRLKKGLQKIIANGDFDRLFERYFYDKIVALHLNERHVICLKSPYFPIDKQCKQLDKINDMYKSEFFPNH